ncbi:hypothetical protein LFZ90_10935 [Salmonella enterica subsp. enterica serovar Blegdam]|nr:hypothetical protein LFZ90_10935 [Salmonella enterica subsp. enterica serovar Blegdam]
MLVKFFDPGNLIVCQLQMLDNRILGGQGEDWGTAVAKAPKETPARVAASKVVRTKFFMKIS